MNNKLFNESGFLTEYGKNLFDQVLCGLDKIMNHAENENELKIIGCLLSNYVANEVSQYGEKFRLKEIEKKLLWNMTDENFIAYLEEKYKDSKNKLGMFSMNAEEVERYQPIAKKRAEKITEELEDFKRQLSKY